MRWNVPDDVAASLAASIGAYIRATPTQDLPGRLRRFKSWRPKALAEHRGELLDVLDDEVERKRMLKWLSDNKSGLRRPDADLLRIACERADEWESELASRSTGPSRTKSVQPGPDLATALQEERRKLRAVKEEARGARREARAAADAERRRTDRLAQEARGLRDRLTAAEKAALVMTSEATRAEATFDRERRKLAREVERAKRERDDLRRELKDARRSNRALERRVAELEANVEKREGSSSPASNHFSRGLAPPPPAERQPLRVPAGLFDDSPKTLSVWLDAPQVTLLVDGYNAAKAQEGYGRLDLPSQRTRLVDEVDRLARRHGVPAIIVFDGAKIAPGVARRRRHGVSVVYSRPTESADDHLVALLDELPNHPVILVTTDRELRERAARQGASLAYSAQLLALIR